MTELEMIEAAGTARVTPEFIAAFNNMSLADRNIWVEDARRRLAGEYGSAPTGTATAAEQATSQAVGSGTVGLRNPNQPPDVDTGIAGTAWAWNAQRGQWVRSYAEFNRQQQQPTQESTPTGLRIVDGPGDPLKPPATPAGPPGMSEKSARSIIREFLSEWGLGGLEDMLYERVVADQDLSDTRLINEVRKTPEYAARFPGMKMRQDQGRVAISEREYLADERAYKQLMQRAGLPTGFYDDPSDFAKFIGGDVSPDELGRRIQQGYQAIAQADPSVRDAMRRFYGVTDGELAAYMLDPGRAESIIMQQAATAQLGAAAARMGFGESADRLAAERMQRLGVTEQEAEQAFGFLSGAQELLSPLEAGETALDVTETAIGLTGRGSPEALQRLRQQQRQRTARFEGGGRFATQGAEVVGLQQA